MNIEIRLEISIPMFNCAAVKKWKQLVTWLLSYRPKCIADTECNFSRKRNVFILATEKYNPFTMALKLVSNWFKPVWPNQIYYVVYRKWFP